MLQASRKEISFGRIRPVAIESNARGQHVPAGGGIRSPRRRAILMAARAGGAGLRFHRVLRRRRRAGSVQFSELPKLRLTRRANQGYIGIIGNYENRSAGAPGRLGSELLAKRFISPDLFLSHLGKANLSVGPPAQVHQQSEFASRCVRVVSLVRALIAPV